MRVTTAVVSLLFAGGVMVSAGAQDNTDTTTSTDTTVTDTGSTTTTTTRTETTTSTNSDAISCPPGTTAVRVRDDQATTARSADTTTAATSDEESRIEMDTIGAGGAPRLRRTGPADDAATTTGASTSTASAEMSADADLSAGSTTTVRTRTTYEENYRLEGNEIADTAGRSRGGNYVRTAASDYDRSRGISDRGYGGAGMSRDVGARRASGWRRGGYTSTGVDLAGLSLLSSLFLTGGLLIRRRPR